MAFLTIEGTEVYVDSEGVSRGEPIAIGEKVRAFDGTLLSTVRGYKYTWTLKTWPLTLAQANTVEAACNANGVGAVVSVAGDLFGEQTVPFDAVVTVTAREPLQDCDDPTGARWFLALSIEQV